MLPKLKKNLNIIEDKYSKAYMKKRKYWTMRDNDANYILHFSKIIIYIFLIYFMMENKITIEFLIMAIAYHASLYIDTDKFLTGTATIREVNVSVMRIKSILHYKNKNSFQFGDYNKDDLKGTIEFQNVSFGYEKKLLLENFNLIIKPSKITMIVGQSGTGKTSIMNLLLRLYKVKKGEILLEGVNIYDYSKKVYTSNVGVVNQKPFLFNMSIRKNLDIIDTDLINQMEACKRVGIHNFIASLPNDYNTILREDASNISGGQKQLISLARTLLSRSEILLLDEITSSLDPNTSKQIAKVLKELKKDHTVIIITHTPKLMKMTDNLIVIDKGIVAGQGKHKQLILKNKYYKDLQK